MDRLTAILKDPQRYIRDKPVKRAGRTTKQNQKVRISFANPRRMQRKPVRSASIKVLEGRVNQVIEGLQTAPDHPDNGPFTWFAEVIIDVAPGGFNMLETVQWPVLD